MSSVALGKLCTYSNGGTPAKGEHSYWGGPHAWITSSEIQDGSVLPARSSVTDLGIAESATNLVPEGTILLVTRTGVGKVAVTPTQLCFSHDITAIFPAKNRLHRDYLAWFLRGQEPYFAQHSRGATIKGITRDALNRLQIPLPPLAEQKRIARLLDTADALRAKRREALAQLDTLLQATFLDLFGDPVTNPKGWELLRFSEIGEIVTGNTPSRQRPEYYSDTIEWIKSDNINDPSFYLTKAEEGLSCEGMKVARFAPPGSILVTCIAGSPSCIGNAAIANRRVAFNQQINALIPNGRVNVYFAFTLLWVAQRLVQKASTNSMKGMVSKSAFSDIRAPIPPIAIQERFAEVFEAIELQKRRYTSHSAELDTLFASLQSRAFRGEL